MRNSQRQMRHFFSQGDDVISSYLSLEQTRMQVPKIWPLGQCAASSAWFSCQMLPALSISGAAVFLLCDAVFKERGCLLWRRLMRNEQPLLNHLPHRGGSHSSCTATEPPSSLSPFTALSLTRLFSSDRSAADYRPWNIGKWVAGPGRGGEAGSSVDWCGLLISIWSVRSFKQAVIEIQSRSEDSRLSDRVYGADSLH